jgi:hypothetical protein
MKLEVNLVSSKIGQIRKKIRAKRLIYRAFVGLVVGASLTVIGLSSYNLVLTRLNQNLEKQIQNRTERIEALREIENKQVYLVSKLKSFGIILSTQERHQAIAETIFSILPAGTELKGFTIEETGKLVLSGSVPGFELLEELLANVREAQTRLPIVEAEMTKVSLGKNGTINFTLNLVVGVQKEANG